MVLIKNIFLPIFCFVFVFGAYAQDIVATLPPTLSLQYYDGICIPFQNSIPLPSFEKQKHGGRNIIDLQGSWKTLRFTANHDLSLTTRDNTTIDAIKNVPISKIWTSSFNDNNWPTKELPAVENIMNYQKNNHYAPEVYEDGVWYRRHFVMPVPDQPKSFKLIFYSVNYICDVWLNDQYLGYHEGGYTPFAFDITNAVRLGEDEDNVIAIRVDNPPQYDTANPQSRFDIIPYNASSAWSQYTGIIHDVFIEESNILFVNRANVVPLGTNGNINTTITLCNQGEFSKTVNVNVKVYNAYVNNYNIDSEYASDLLSDDPLYVTSSSFNLTVSPNEPKPYVCNMVVPNPQLWSPKYPNLYVLRVTLTDPRSGELLDDYYTQFGIRTISVSGTHGLLNDKPVFFTGLNREEDDSLLGRSVTKLKIKNDLALIKNLNCNFLRTSHYPNHLFTYLMSDRLGIAITEEIPLFWFEWQGWLHHETRRIHQQMFEEMVFKDYNRPSILLWSIGNESGITPKKWTN